MWPLNPNGELLLRVITESKAGIANTYAIAAMPGVAVVTAGRWNGGRRLLDSESTGRRVRDPASAELFAG